jgi:hypothetical protein
MARGGYYGAFSVKCICLRSPLCDQSQRKMYPSAAYTSDQPLIPGTVSPEFLGRTPGPPWRSQKSRIRSPPSGEVSSDLVLIGCTLK